MVRSSCVSSKNNDLSCREVSSQEGRLGKCPVGKLWEDDTTMSLFVTHKRAHWRCPGPVLMLKRRVLGSASAADGTFCHLDFPIPLPRGHVAMSGTRDQPDLVVRRSPQKSDQGRQDLCDYAGYTILFLCVVPQTSCDVWLRAPRRRYREVAHAIASGNAERRHLTAFGVMNRSHVLGPFQH